MNETKPWYQSIGVWASLVQVLVGVAVSLGFVDQAAGSTIADQLPGLIVAIVTSLAGAASLWGRVYAKKEITATNENK